jgi:hypothetical protein
MVKIFWRSRLLRAFFQRPSSEDAKRVSPRYCFDWARDPLSHPAVDAMNLNQIADLPARQLRSCCEQ